MIRPARLFVGFSSALLVVVAACSQYRPGDYQGGGRTEPPIINEGIGSACIALGRTCGVDTDCCSGFCEFSFGFSQCAERPDGSSFQTCASAGSPCTLSSDCCSNACAGQICVTVIPDAGGGG